MKDSQRRVSPESEGRERWGETEMRGREAERKQQSTLRERHGKKYRE